MANNNSQKKRNRQNEKRREHNSRIKTAIRTSIKKVMTAITASSDSNAEDADKAFINFVSKIDAAAGKSILHKKTVARKKSRIAKKLNQSKQKSAS